MARPREFDSDQALDKAVQVFWTGGYEATSLCDLLAAMGLSKSSFYETFGSKHALFLAALDRYEKTETSRAVAWLEQPGSPRKAIRALFERLVEKACTKGERSGCFLNNCAVEQAPHDAQASARVSTAMTRMEEAFRRAVKRGQGMGEINRTHDARALARFLNSNLNGLNVVAKVNPDRKALKDVVAVVMNALD